MHRRLTTPIRIGLCLILSPLFSSGCAKRASESLPPDELARGAVKASLEAWRKGEKPGTLPGTSPPVQVFDTPWSLGNRLASYEILEGDRSDAEMRFSVRLTLSKPERVEEVQYYVLGRDPVMVFRDEDYRRNINMENGPDLKKSRSKKVGRTR